MAVAFRLTALVGTLAALWQSAAAGWPTCC